MFFLFNRSQVLSILVLMTLSLLVVSGCGKIIKYELMRSKAEYHLDRQSFFQAIELFESYLKENPDNLYVRNRLGYAYLKTEQYPDAVQEFETVLAGRPGDPHATLYLGMAYINTAQYGKTIEIWNGYRDVKQPLVEAEIKRQLTLLQIAESKRLAKQALAEEKKRMTESGSADGFQSEQLDANTIAVCYYRDSTPDNRLRAFQKGLTAMVSTDLSKIEQFRVVERARLQALLEEMAFGQTGIVDENTAPRVGRLLQAENLVVGNLAEGSIQVTTSMASTRSGEVTGSAAASFPMEKFYEIPGMIAMSVAKVLGIEPTAEEAAAIGIPQTKVLAAFTFYGQALDALDQGNWEEARNFFDKALDADPQFRLAQDGRDSCPSSNTPSIKEFSRMKPNLMATRIEETLDTAIAEQEAADREAASMNSGGGGGDGDGGGGHGH